MIQMMLTIRGAAKHFKLDHSDVTRLLRRNGYRLPRVKRGQSILVRLSDVQDAMRRDRDRRTVQPKGKRR